MKLDFMGPSMDASLAFSRASAAGYYGTSGLVLQASSGVPRFDYNPATQAMRGILLEDARTNICLRSAAFSNASWVRTNCTVGTDAVTDAAGGSTYDSLTASAANATALQTITVTNATTYTFAIDLIRITGSGNVQLTIDNGATWTTVAVTGTLTRFYLTGTSTSTTMVVGIRIVTSGDAVGAGAAQLEQGEYGSSRLTTAGTSQARSRDVLGINLPAPFYVNSNGFAIMAELEIGVYSNSTTRLLRLSDGTANNALLLNVSSAGLLGVSNVVGGSATTANSSGSLALNTVHKVGLICGPDGLVAVGNGVIYKGLVDRPVQQTSLMTSLDLSPGAGTGQIWMRRLQFWRYHIQPERMAALTAS